MLVSMGGIKKYWLFIIFNTGLKENEIKNRIDKIMNKVDIHEVLDMGTKLLAYEVKGQKQGHYYKITFDGNIDDLELPTDDDVDVIKKLIIKVD